MPQPVVTPASASAAVDGGPSAGPRVGVVGAGQLARMMQLPAIELGLELRLLAETEGAPAAQVIPRHVVGDYRDLETLQGWASDCDIVTFDHEHVPTGHLQALESDGTVCRPGPTALVYAQDKLLMRERLSELGVPCPRHARVSDSSAVTAFAARGRGYPVVLKTPRGGYDGKGVWMVDDEPAAAAVLEKLADDPGSTRLGEPLALLAEERVAFVRELAALVARAPSGQVAAYPIVETIQRNGVCDEVIVPAPGLRPEISNAAQRLAMRVAAELDVTGILAVELFELSGGELLVNELAMRPHNTGHWSIDAAVTSQFENHLRAVLDLPLGAPHVRERWAVMVNILGGDVPALPDGFPHVMARDPYLRVHLYGKEVRPGRKVGHVTAYGQDLADVRARARHAARWFAEGIDDSEEAHP